MRVTRSSISACLTLFAMLSTACWLSACKERLPDLLTQVRIDRVKVDPQALSCRPRPGALGQDATVRELVALTGEAIDWGGDCEDRLGTVAAIVAPLAPVAAPLPADQQAPPPAAPTTRAALAWVLPQSERISGRSQDNESPFSPRAPP